VLFISSCPGMTGLTGVSDRSDRCEPFVGFASGELLVPCVFGLCCFWSVLVWFGGVLLGFVKGSSSLLVVFWGVFVLGSREVIEALWNICCAAVVATGLTSSIHRSDRCSTRSKPCKFLSYGPPWAHYLGGYQDRLLGGPLGLPGLRYTAPEGVEHKD
jgi:hypothetical protein